MPVSEVGPVGMSSEWREAGRKADPGEWGTKSGMGLCGVFALSLVSQAEESQQSFVSPQTSLNTTNYPKRAAWALLSQEAHLRGVSIFTPVPRRGWALY